MLHDKVLTVLRSNSTPSARRSRSLAAATVLRPPMSSPPSPVHTATATPVVRLSSLSLHDTHSHPISAVNIDVYSNAAQTQTTYVIPGPPLYGSGTGAPAPAPVSHLLNDAMSL